MCEASEADARKEIVKAWPSFAKSAKTRCIQTSAGHARSYAELFSSVLKSMRDMQKRQEQERATPARPQSR